MDPKHSSCSSFPIPPYDDVNLTFEAFSPLQSFPPFDLDFAAPVLSQPLECLQGNPIPPFLSKTYDLVEEPALDPIISWGGTGGSFVVWDPIEFARVVLPKNFKHNNFSSFVRQLNTYGFRKIDTDKWEFANESFLRGRKHLLKNIKRRRTSPQSHQATSEASGSGIETELVKLRNDKSVLMQELVELQVQHRGTAERVETVKQRLVASEQRQKQIVSFLAKSFQNPEFLGRLRQMKEQKLVESPRNKRKLKPNVSMDERQQITSSSDVLNSFPLQEIIMPSETENQLDYFVDFPETERLIAPEEFDLWSSDQNYEFMVPGSSFSDGWDLGFVGSSEMDQWPSDESPAGGSGSNVGDDT